MAWLRACQTHAARFVGSRRCIRRRAVRLQCSHSGKLCELRRPYTRREFQARQYVTLRSVRRRTVCLLDRSHVEVCSNDGVRRWANIAFRRSRVLLLLLLLLHLFTSATNLSPISPSITWLRRHTCRRQR